MEVITEEARMYFLDPFDWAKQVVGLGYSGLRKLDNESSRFQIDSMP